MVETDFQSDCCFDGCACLNFKLTFWYFGCCIHSNLSASAASLRMISVVSTESVTHPRHGNFSMKMLWWSCESCEAR